MSILDISKALMYEFWYDYIQPKYQDRGKLCYMDSDKPKYQGRAKLCYMDTDSFVIHIKTEDFYENIANDVEEWFDTTNYDNNRPLPLRKNKKVIDLFINELGGKIMKEFVGLRAKTYAYLMDDDTEHKKAKGTKKCVIKRGLMLENYKNCL